MTKRPEPVKTKAEQYREAARNRKRCAGYNTRVHASNNPMSETFGYGVGLKRIVLSTDKAFVKKSR